MENKFCAPSLAACTKAYQFAYKPGCDVTGIELLSKARTLCSLTASRLCLLQMQFAAPRLAKG
jgi:hypothetical protein